jgi:hypothetical protein
MIGLFAMLSVALAAVAGPHTVDSPLAVTLTTHPAVRALHGGLPRPAVPATPDALAVDARAVQVRALGDARALAAVHPGEAQPLAYALWAKATRPDIREAALEIILDDAIASFPKGFRRRFLAEVMPAVLPAAREWHVPPSVTLAQAILESGWGRSGLAANHHNLFGVKAGASDQKVRMASREHLWGRLRPSRQTFRTYEDKGESITHHARLLGSDRRYAHARPHWAYWQTFLEEIAPRYASSPKYVEKVSEIVEHYELDRWDALVVAAAASDAGLDAEPWLAKATEGMGDALADAE